MMIFPYRVACTLIFTCCPLWTALAQDEPQANPQDTPPPPVLTPQVVGDELTTALSSDVLDRADQQFRNAKPILEILDPTAQITPLSREQLQAVPKEMLIGKVYQAGVRNPPRYLFMRLELVNPTDKFIEVDRATFQLKLPNKTLHLTPPPSQQGLNHIQTSTGSIEIRELKTEGTVGIPAQSVAEVPVAFFGLPSTTEIPAMVLEIPVEGGPTAKSNLGWLALGKMQATVEFAGPSNLVGVVTIKGKLDNVAVGGLIDLLNHLVKQKTRRAIVAWVDDAPNLDSDLSMWIHSYGMHLNGQPQNDGRHPPFPDGLDDLRFANLPAATSHFGSFGKNFVHETVQDALYSVLADAYRVIPLNELRHEILSGNPLSRPTALASAGRLPESDLPMIIELSGAADETMAIAATVALGAFPFPAAVDRLKELVLHGPPAVREAAMESLASARYGVAHQALKALLEQSRQQPSSIPVQALADVLTRYPRPLWRDTLFELSFEGDAESRGAVLHALANAGHPQLKKALLAALDSGDVELQDHAIELLTRQPDAESEHIVLAHIREHLETKPPTKAMIKLIMQLKDPVSADLILKGISQVDNETMQIMPMMVKIGGPEIRKRLEDLYDKTPKSLQPQMFSYLQQIQSPKVVEIAKQLLSADSDDGSVSKFNVINAFRQSDSPQVVQLLIDELANAENDAPYFDTLCHVLAEIGSPQAMIALRQAMRREGDAAERAGRHYMQILARSSPGWSKFQQGVKLADEKQWNESISFLSQAIEYDPDLVDARAQRAHVYMQLEEHAKARRDFEQTLRCDPKDPAAVTCISILDVIAGDVEQGLQRIEQQRTEFAHDDLFSYNSACAKALASESLEATDPSRAEQLRKEAVGEIKRAFDLGMTTEREVEWTQEDPDLRILRDRKDFQETVEYMQRGVDRTPENMVP